MAGFRALSPNINVNTESGQLRTELQNTFARLDGSLQLAPYRIATQVGPASNSGSSETDLFSVNIDVGTLAKQNSSILIFACGNTAANGNNKTFKMKFGSTTLFTSGAFAGNNISWTFQAEIVRNGSNAQVFWSQWSGSATLTNVVTTGTANEDLAVTQAITFTGQGTATGDISMLYYKLLLLT